MTTKKKLHDQLMARRDELKDTPYELSHISCPSVGLERGDPGRNEPDRYVFQHTTALGVREAWEVFNAALIEMGSLVAFPQITEEQVTFGDDKYVAHRVESTKPYTERWQVVRNDEATPIGYLEMSWDVTHSEQRIRVLATDGRQIGETVHSYLNALSHLRMHSITGGL